MPYKKTLGRKEKLSGAAVAYLSDDETVSDIGNFSLWCFRHGLPGYDWDPAPQDLWQRHRDEFLLVFIAAHPGFRPIGWWHWDCPRWKDSPGGAYEALPEPRKMIAGKGMTPWDAGLAIVPSFCKGIPTSWQTIDVNDPPVFESEASFLDRHGLLTVEESKILKKMPAARFHDIMI